jgi:hypothetical protein
MTQQDRLVVEAVIWSVAGGGDEPNRNWTELPDVPEPEAVTSVEKLVIAEGGQPIALLRNYEARPSTGAGWGQDRPARPPHTARRGSARSLVPRSRRTRGWTPPGSRWRRTSFRPSPWRKASPATEVNFITRR